MRVVPSPAEWVSVRPLIRREHSTGLYSAPIVFVTRSFDVLALLVCSFVLYSVQVGAPGSAQVGGHGGGAIGLAGTGCAWRAGGRAGHAGDGMASPAAVQPGLTPRPTRRRWPAQYPMQRLRMEAANYFVWLAAVILTTVGSFFLGFAVVLVSGNAPTALALQSAISLVLISSSGFLNPTPPPYLLWLQQANFQTYSYCACATRAGRQVDGAGLAAQSARAPLQRHPPPAPRAPSPCSRAVRQRV